MRFRTCLLAFLLFGCVQAFGRVQPARYGLTAFPDSQALERMTLYVADSFLINHPLNVSHNVISDIELPHTMQSQTADFYLLLFLCLMLGLIRFTDTRYFLNLWRAFWNPTLSNRQLKDQLQGSGLPNLLMNI